MYEKEELRLSNYKKKMEKTEIPVVALNDAILTGFAKAKSKEKVFHRKKRWILQAAMVAVILIAFVTTIRVSPVFAEYVSAIPGMEKIVKLIRHDKGMVTAINNDYYQDIDVSVEKNGLEVIIDGAIADENGIVLFYTLNTEKKQKEITIEEVKLESTVGEKLDFSSMTYGFPHFSEQGQKTYSGVMEYFFQSPYESRSFEIDLHVVGDTVNEKFIIPFTLEKNFETKKSYEINKTVTIGGQRIFIEEVTVYPLRVAVRVKKDPNNTKNLLYFEDLRLVDEHGEEWSKISNGITVSQLLDEEEIIYLESNYFKEPEELYLIINRIQAIDKADDMVVVDLEKVEILNQPEGNMLREIEITKNEINFKLYTTEGDFPFGLFGEIMDASGNKMHPESISFSSGGSESDGITKHGIQLKNLNSYESPISIELAHFPKWISGNERIRIK
ncbi:DUF4179 domain-containing protein [Virgibacillus sp. C22-A2]|uniref:DUF4179 domain-containing protein n=1 Tax=Virgibacillus tibetensis TaxID=3042313 RepID=A0ABU6KJP2_9BACI|nr:DUF4179 domain-containing protein [Virgibacillus sp. C22-A2]